MREKGHEGRLRGGGRNGISLTAPHAVVSG